MWVLWALDFEEDLYFCHCGVSSSPSSTSRTNAYPREVHISSNSSLVMRCKSSSNGDDDDASESLMADDDDDVDVFSAADAR